MKSIDAPPDPALLESMRSIGYTVESAVADVIDNSIAAGATQVHVLVSAEGPFQLAVVDNGRGMTRPEAVDAMRLAAVSPTKARVPEDLGRFGLGLKTASLSQCRTVTLVTKAKGTVTALQWSLDHVMTTGQWALIELEIAEVQGLLGWRNLAAASAGTLVHWGDLDQLAMTEGKEQEDLDRVALRVRDHIALVFHLFMSGDGVRKIAFRLNGGAIAPLDPFMSTSTKTQPTEWEPIDVEGETVRLKAFTLPHLDRLSTKERNNLLRLGTLRDTQGFYVYRGGRLVIWGTWFRVTPRSEMAKLTRVRVDIPNSLDHLWALDVKKSTAEPPPKVRNRLRELARTMTLPGERVQKFRGRKVSTSLNVDYLWNVFEDATSFRYEINSAHPTIETFKQDLSEAQRLQFELVLDDIEATFPVIDAHNRMSGDRIPSLTPDDEILLKRAEGAWELMRGHGLPVENFIAGLASADPYCEVPNFAHIMKERLTP